MRSSTLAISMSVFLVVLLVGFGVTTAQADGPEVTWERMVGIVQAPGSPIGGRPGEVPVGGVEGSIFFMSAKGGKAKLNLENGDIKFKVKGLELASGLTFTLIGTTGPVSTVRGTLVCNVTGEGTAVEVNTPAVPLSAQGDAKFRGNIDPPFDCTDEPDDIAFLIVIDDVIPDVPTIHIDRWVAHGAVRKLLP